MKHHTRNRSWVLPNHLIRRLQLTLCIAATWISGVAPAYAYEWVKYEAGDLTVFSDCSPDKAKSFGRHFAAYQFTLRQRLLPPGAPLRHTTLVLFADSKEFERYFQSEEYQYGKRITLHSTRPVARGRMIATLNDHKLDQRINSIIELDAFYLLPWYAEAPPAWINVALQETFSKFRYRLGAVVFEEVDDNRRIALKNHQWRNWDVVIGIAKDELLEEESIPTNTAQAQRWLLGDWLLNGGARARSVCFNLLQAYRTEFPTTIATFEVGIGTNCARLTEELLGHFRDPKSTRSLRFDGDAFEAGLESSPASAQEIHLIKFHLLFGREPTALALDELEQAIKCGPDTDDVRVAKVLAAKLRDDRTALIEVCDAAIAGGTRNPFFFLNRATARLFHESHVASEVFGLSRRIKAGTSPDADEVAAAVAEIRTAQKLDPIDPFTFVQLAEAINFLPSVSDEHIDELSPGVSETPYGRYVRLIRGLLKQRLGVEAQSNDDLEHILKVHPESREAQFIRESRDRWAAIQTEAEANRHLNDLIAQRRFAEAQQLLSERLEAESNITKRNLYAKEIARLGETMAWEEIMSLTREERWTEVKTASERYIMQYPKSHRVQVIKNRLRKAQEILGN